MKQFFSLENLNQVNSETKYSLCVKDSELNGIVWS